MTVPLPPGPLAVAIAIAVPVAVAVLFRYDPVPYFLLEAAVADVRAARGRVAGWLAIVATHAALAIGVAWLIVGATALLLGIDADPLAAALAGLAAMVLLKMLEPAWRFRHEYRFEMR